MKAPLLELITDATRLMLLLWLLCPIASAAQNDFVFVVENGAVTLTAYAGSGGAVEIPRSVDGLPVTKIGSWAFSYRKLMSVTIPDSVTQIGEDAFKGCSDLTPMPFMNSEQLNGLLCKQQGRGGRCFCAGEANC